MSNDNNYDHLYNIKYFENITFQTFGHQFIDLLLYFYIHDRLYRFSRFSYHLNSHIYVPLKSKSWNNMKQTIWYVCLPSKCRSKGIMG